MVFVFLILLNSLIIPTFASDSVVAIINDERIYLSDFERLLKTKKEKVKKEKILNTLINEKLVLQEARKRKVEIREEEIDKQYLLIRTSFQSKKEFDNFLNENDATAKLLRKAIKKKLLYKKTKKELLRTIPVTNKEIKDFYKKHPSRNKRIKNTPLNQVTKKVIEKIQEEKGKTAFKEILANLKKESSIIVFKIPVNSKEQTAKSQQPIAKSKKLIANSQQPIANSQQLKANNQQPIAKSKKLTAKKLRALSIERKNLLSNIREKKYKVKFNRKNAITPREAKKIRLATNLRQKPILITKSQKTNIFSKEYVSKEGNLDSYLTKEIVKSFKNTEKSNNKLDQISKDLNQLIKNINKRRL